MARYFLPSVAALAALFLFLNAAGASAPGGSVSGPADSEMAPGRPVPHLPHHLPDRDPLSCPICDLARKLELQMTPLLRPTLLRCPPHLPAFLASAPRGRIRADRFTHVRLDLGVEYGDAVEEAAGARVEFRAGERVIGSLPFEPTDLVTVLVLPDALRLKLQASREPITWGSGVAWENYERPTVHVDDPTWQEARRLRAIDERLALQPEWIRRLLRAQALVDMEFLQEAHEEARAVLALQPREPHAAAILHLMHLTLGLRHTQAEAYDHAGGLVLSLYEARRQRKARMKCMLDDPLEQRPKPVRTIAGPRGGC